MSRRSILRVTALAGCLLLTTGGSRAAGRGQTANRCPERPVAAIGPELPADVCIPDAFTGIAVDYFDDYSWRAFAALVWPAEPGTRGAPASTRPVTAGGPRVFETFKPLWEIFHRDGSAPVAAYDGYDASGHNPCGVPSAFGEMTIGSVSGIDDIGQAAGGVLDGPIVAQNGRYVRTLTSFNRLAFDHIVRNRYYLRSALPEIPRPRPDRPVLEFPVGSVAIKSAWVDVAGFPPALVRRLYTRPAMVKRAAGEVCARVTMGLIGLHIAQKTASRPQWIWSTFEHNDAVPPAWPDTPGFLLHDGSAAPMPAENPVPLVPLAPEPARPFNVTRHRDAPILTPTELSSFQYQRLLEGTPFRYYKLVMTQWPRLEGAQSDPIPASVDGSPANTFPGLGAFSAFANVTMETFNQHNVQVGCMNCHTRTRLATDFMWTLFDHAYPAQLRPARTGTH